MHGNRVITQIAGVMNSSKLLVEFVENMTEEDVAGLRHTVKFANWILQAHKEAGRRV